MARARTQTVAGVITQARDRTLSFGLPPIQNRVVQSSLSATGFGIVWNNAAGSMCRCLTYSWGKKHERTCYRLVQAQDQFDTDRASTRCAHILRPDTAWRGTAGHRGDR